MKKYFRKIASISKTKPMIYMWLLLLSILCFGILIPKLGFYWDDLPYLYQYAAFGPQGFGKFVSSDRPFSGWIFSVTTFLFGFNSTGYHLLALVLRWVCAILFYEIIRLVWKSESKFFYIAAASIFTVYPGFLQQPIALIYNHHLSVFCFFLLSMYLMIINQKREKTNPIFTYLSILLSFGMFSIENFATLEIIRPFVLWKISTQKEPQLEFTKRIARILRTWLPYVAIFILFIYWRVIVFKFPTYQPSFLSNALGNPVNAIQSLLTRIPKDFFTITAGAWLRSFKFPVISEFGSAATLLTWVLMGFTFIASSIVYYISTKDEDDNNHHKSLKFFTLNIFVSSFCLFILSGSIVWVLDLPLEIEFAWDRMTIAFLPSAALFGAGLILIFKKSKVLQAFMFSTLISFAIGSHFENEMAYKRDWETFQDFNWQLSWRVPSLSENTILIASDVGLKYYSDSSLTAPVNLTFSDPIFSNQLSHLVYYSDARDDSWFENEIKNQEIRKDYRSFQFEGNSSDAVTFQFDPPGCLKILDSKYANSVTNPNLSFRQVKEISYSKIDLIFRQPIHVPDKRLFPEKSTNNWCYYFEKADLSRQYSDYAEIEQLGNAAIDANYYPRIASEWLPFLEGYLWMGDLERARWIADQVQSAEGNYSEGLCYTFDRILKNKDFPFINDLKNIRLSYNCR